MSMFTDLLGSVRQAFKIGIRGVTLQNKAGQSPGAEVLQVLTNSAAPAAVETGTLTVTGNVAATGNVSGTWTGTVIDVAHGGTGSNTTVGSFDTLAPTTTKGDLIVHDGTNNVRLPVGTNGQVLVADSTAADGIKWATSPGGTVTAVSVASANGFAGTSDGDAETPTLTLTTTETGILKGSAGALVAATPGTDYLTVLTGDVTTSGNAATLATVNSNVGAFGSATAVPTFTVNAKGLITAAGSTSIQIAESQITDGAILARLADNETVTGNWTFSNPVSGAAPVAGSDLATKTYVDNIAAGLSWKQPVRVATTGNIALTGTQTIDGVAVIAGDRVLVKDQSTASQNGIYVVAAGAWVRATDFDSTSPIDEINGAAVYVKEGTNQADTGWTQIDTVATIGTDPISFVQFAGGGSYQAGDGLALTGNIFSVVTADSANVTVGAGGVNLATVTNNNTGTFVKVDRDAYGRVAGTTAVVASDISSLVDARYVLKAGDTISGNLIVTGTVTASNLSGTNTGDQTITLTGDVTGSGTGSFAATIGANTVTNAKLAQMAAGTVKANLTGSAANASDVTVADLTAALGEFTDTLQGVVPASGGGTTNFLRADGTWADPTASVGASRWTAESISFTYNTGGTSSVQLPAGGVVHDVQVVIDTAFLTADPTVTVATGSQTFVGASDTAYLGLPVGTVFEIHPGLPGAGSADTITVSVTSNGATAGAGRVIITYAIPL